MKGKGIEVYIYVTIACTSHTQFPGKAQLRLSCSNSKAAVEIITPGGDVEVNSTQLEGRCVVNQPEPGVLLDIEEVTVIELSLRLEVIVCQDKGTDQSSYRSTCQICHTSLIDKGANYSASEYASWVIMCTCFEANDCL